MRSVFREVARRVANDDRQPHPNSLGSSIRARSRRDELASELRCRRFPSSVSTRRPSASDTGTPSSRHARRNAFHCSSVTFTRATCCSTSTPRSLDTLHLPYPTAISRSRRAIRASDLTNTQIITGRCAPGEATQAPRRFAADEVLSQPSIEYDSGRDTTSIRPFDASGEPRRSGRGGARLDPAGRPRARPRVPRRCRTRGKRRDQR